MDPQRLFRCYLAVCATGIAGYFLLPPHAQNLAFIVSNVIGCGAVLLAWRSRRLTPSGGWLLVAAFSAATGVGNVVYFVNDSILGVNPFPSLGDAAFLGAYLLLAAGLLRLQRARTAGRDLPAVLDTAVITVGFAVASWVVFMAPLLQESGLPLVERVTALGYPVADVLVVAVAVRFLLTRGRGPAFRLLAAVVVAMVTSDTVFAVLNLLDLYSTGHPIDALILTYNLGWGAVALHPASASLAAPVVPTTRRPSWWRLTALTTASLVAPVTLVAQVLTGQLTGVVVTGVGAVTLFLLVVLRMDGLIQRLETTLAERQRLEVELEHRSLHDDLTGLANRRLFVAEVASALTAMPQGGVAVLYIDLDRFKAINDTLGHAAGDVLLVTTATRLHAVLGPDDVAARLGGDEFAVLLRGQPMMPSGAAQVAAVVSAALDRPVRFSGNECAVTASVGSAVALPGDGVDDLLHAADTAMYGRKATRGDRRAPTGLPPVPTPASLVGAQVGPAW